MTPLELLESVKARFVVLLHDEPAKLEALLKQAIGEYQDRAGAIVSIKTEKAELDLPPYYLDLVMATDSAHAWHEVIVDAGKLKVVADNYSQPPYSIQYLLDLRVIDLETGVLPPESIGLLQRYLYALIDRPNTERIRQVNLGAGLPVDQLPAASELTANIQAVEQEIIDRAAMLAPALVV